MGRYTSESAAQCPNVFVGDSEQSIPTDFRPTEEPVLRHVEVDVLIPKLMREKAKELCVEKVEAFSQCCKENGFLMAFKCREQNAALKECLTAYYTDPAFFEECKLQYIKEKLEFQKTGISAKKRIEKLPTSM